MSDIRKCTLTWLTQNMSHIGQFLIGLAAVIALYKSDGILEKIQEIKEIISVIRSERIYTQQLRITTEQSPETRIELFKDLIKSDKDKILPGNLYLSSEEYNKAIDLLKSNDKTSQSQFLQEKLKVWEKENR